MSTISDNFDIFECDFRPINKYVVLQKCTVAEKQIAPDGRPAFMEDGIILTDTHADNTQWCRILLVADDCEIFSDADQFRYTMCPEYSKTLHCIDWDEDKAVWMIREDELPAFTIESF